MKRLVICVLGAALAVGPAYAQWALVSPDTRRHIEDMTFRAGLRVLGEIKAENLLPGRCADFWFDIRMTDNPEAVVVACDDNCGDFAFTVFDEYGFEIGSPAGAAHFVFRGEGHGNKFYVRVRLEDCSETVCNVGVAQVGQ